MSALKLKSYQKFVIFNWSDYKYIECSFIIKKTFSLDKNVLNNP